MKPIVEEYEVETCIEDWLEIAITHKDINIEFIEKILPKFIELDFVCDAYFADNGIFRICMLGNEKRLIPLLHKGVPADIILHPKLGRVELMRNHNSEIYKEREDKIIQIICEELER